MKGRGDVVPFQLVDQRTIAPGVFFCERRRLGVSEADIRTILADNPGQAFEIASG